MYWDNNELEKKWKPEYKFPNLNFIMNISIYDDIEWVSLPPIYIQFM